MDKKNTLSVRFLGGFSVTYNGHNVMESQHSVSQFSMLMQLVLYYRKKDHTDGNTAGTASETAHWFSDLFGRATGKDINGKEIIDGNAEEVTDDDTHS